jgi:peptidoglycan/LPS O-acetylase OafA/YrhL
MRRLVEADMLRTVAIVLIVLTHLPDYFPLPGLQPYTVYTILFGNGLFIFLSGYLIHATTRSRPRSSLTSFMGHRLLRIMPLYWLALAVFFVVVARTDLWTMLLHLAGLQIVLAPVMVTPMATLWFIGMILIFYLIYYAVVRPVSRPRDMLLVAALALLPMIAVRTALGIVEMRFFLYYFVFMAGVAVCESGLLERAQSRDIALLTASSAVFLIMFVLDGSPLIGEATGPAYPGLIATMAIANGMIISTALLAWLVAKRIVPRLRPGTVKTFAGCSIASFFVYLFHRPALVVTGSVLGRTGLAVPVQFLAALLIVVPFLFLIGYGVQGTVSRETGRAMGRLRGNGAR